MKTNEVIELGSIDNNDDVNQAAFQEAFDRAIGNFANGHADDRTQQQDEQAVVDSSSDYTQEQNEESQDDTQSSISQYAKEDAAPAEGSQEKSGRTDWKALYFETQNKATLTNARLANLSDQYQQLKNAFADLQNKKVEVEQPVIDYSKISVDDLPEEMKEIALDYPGAFKLIQYVMGNQINQVKDQTQSALDNKVGSVQKQLQMMEMDRARQVVESVHPDARSIVASEDFYMWVQSLPPIARNGVVEIYKNGTVEETIHMLNEYKQARGINVGSNYPSSQNGSVQVPAQNQNPSGRSVGQPAGGVENEALVDRVKASLAVPSHRTPVKIDQQQKPITAEDAFNSVVDEYERNRSSNRRRY